MAQNAGLTVLLIQENLAQKIALTGVRLLIFEKEQVKIEKQPEENPVSHATSDYPAYLIYTSGSTGKPKGVCICHRNVARLVVNTNYADLGPHQVFLQFAPISFDASTFEIWGALLNGGRLVIFPACTPSAEELGDWLSQHDVTTLWLTAGLFHQMMEADTGRQFRHVRQLLAGGDVLSLGLVHKFLNQYPDCRLINGYGPTENCTFSTCGELRDMPDNASSVIIGKPIANSTAYVLDHEMEPMRNGDVGELYLGGSGLAHGYWNQPTLTAEKFVPHPFSETPGERLYRSGDLGRFLADGNLEFAGRIDNQIKLRGFRIELEEIEVALAQHCEVAQAVVILREDNPGDKRIVAYVVPRIEQTARAFELRKYLSERLPEYMVPSAFVFQKSLPLTLNGKVDRRALPAPKRDRSVLERSYDAPTTSTESRLCAIWAEVLHLDKVGVNDNFFELGGDSLVASRILSRVRMAFGASLPLRTFFERPVISHIARFLERVRTEKSETQFSVVGSIPRGEEVPLGCSQERVWFLQKLDVSNIAYNFQATLHISGPLNVEALERSLTSLVQRHEILRTTFVEKDGRAVQQIHEPMPVVLPVINLRHIQTDHLDETTERLIQAEITKRFELDHLPLIRWILISLRESEHLLLHVEHHLIHDGWSFNVFLGELFEFYKSYASGNSLLLPPLPVQFADFAAWQQHSRHSEAMQIQLSYWKQKLFGSLPVSEMPTDYTRPRVQSFKGGLFRIPLSPELCTNLRSFAQEEEASLFVVMMSAFFALTYHYVRQDDFCVGSSVANRQRPETEGLLGMLVNNVVLRAQMSAGMSFHELLEQVRILTFEAYENQDVPFQDVVQSLNLNHDLSSNPLFQTTFNFHNSSVALPELPELKLRLVEGVGNGGAKLIPSTEQRLALNPEWDKDAVVMLWEYNTGLFEENTITRMIVHYQRLLEAMIAVPNQALTEASLLTDSERQQVLYEWNRTRAEIPVDKCVHELFEAQVRNCPHAPAVVQNERTLTYAELNCLANQMARHLRSMGIQPGESVALLLDRSIDLVIAELAVLKCGAVYVPLDPSFPQERKAFMVEDTCAKFVLCAERAQFADKASVQRINIDTQDLSGSTTDDLKIALHSDATAYVMYTSGSTGKPKGIMIPHQGIKRLVLNNGYARFDAGVRMGFAANPAFDATTLELWTPLLHGGVVVVIPQEAVLDPGQFGQVLKRHAVNVLFLTVGLFNQYADTLMEEFADLRYLMVGGDVLDPQVVARVLRGTRPEHLLNAYGPTEATTMAATYEIAVPPENLRRIPIGRPISNTQLYILNEASQPVPIGVTGELYIGGSGLAHGYFNRPELTAERFVPNMFSGEPGARMYRTGDLCRWKEDGTVDFIGRNDFQVKVRGFRIELEEIEAKLADYPGIGNVAVIVREDEPGNRRLVAYYTCEKTADHQESDNVQLLRAHLAARLPEYMLPAAFVRMDVLPLTTSGKLDRKALPIPAGDAYVAHEYEAPQSDMEATLASIFEETLNVERVGRHDNFFELGGHSLLVTKLISRVRSVLGVELVIRNVFEFPTVAGLAPIAEKLIFDEIAEMPEAEAVHIAGLLSEKE
jgi:amino acid adenylation domain-containing protein